MNILLAVFGGIVAIVGLVLLWWRARIVWVDDVRHAG